MFLSKDDWINQRAYALWEAEGRPDGRGGAHWQQAAREYQLLERTRASADGSDLIERLKTMGRMMREADRDDRAETPENSASSRR
ncbi:MULTISPECIES: DUF2934 domain-containing protein [unclassified Rhizobium]|uniref:DUF2934 domain-containing protein n=1 Tax=unclassified Rhizobium TaxID=2613769 RepID=UPI001ADBC6DC|nr:MULTISPECIES: DUF2934 domain-containing protein [unclassified Rhizobium]MBO9127141.1 DUF2934 domain-containing protein [Rhizobium sp. 16-488-2b]MBO9177588.1 DUF2934 domain-containing protein [Rhizobium sp. 16-488-2a]